MTIKTTEREVAIWLCQVINELLGRGGYPFKEATAETGLSQEGSTSKFPDIVLWINRQAQEAFAFFEIKPPDKQEDIKRIPTVMDRLNVHYAITWNFKEAKIYYRDKGALEDKNTYPTFVISNLEEWTRYDKQNQLRKCLRDFLDDLKEYHEKGHQYRLPPNRYYFVKLLRETSDKLFAYFENHIAQRRREKIFGESIEAYIAAQGLPDLETKAGNEFIARHWVYSLITKIIFYLTIRRHFTELPDIVVESKEAKSLNDIINAAFNKARQIDWQAVFEEEDFVDRIKIPSACDDILRELLNKLDEYNFAKLKEDVIGEIFEYIIPDDRKHELGQYFTREDLVDFIIGFVVDTPKGFYCDPTCGSGTFLNRLYARLKWLTGNGIKHNEILPQIWGFDIAKFPAELATINLFRHDLANFKNFPRIRVKDFFEIKPGQSFEFPLPQNVGEITKADIGIPQFAGMVGNFPFIRQEQIEKKIKGYKKKITQKIAVDWFREYRDIFATSKITDSEYKNIKSFSDERLVEYISGFTNGNKFDLKLSGQADIYAYLFIHAAKFVAIGGRMGFITSNSYLDVGYGYELKNFFLDKFKVVAVVASWAEPWFDFASVNTVFTILERCDDPKERNDNIVKFVKVKKPLKELIRYPDLESDERWSHIDKLVRKIESGRPLKTPKAKKSDSPFVSVEDDDFRIRHVPQSHLNDEITENGEFAKWGKYLRAPDIYFEIMEKAKDKLVPLKSIANVRFGIKTGINDFFYLEPTGDSAKDKNYLNVKNAVGWVGDIEKKFLKPVIKSPKESDSIIIDKEKLRYKLFMCGLSKTELKKSGSIKALRYIEWGEKQKTDEGIEWPEVSSVKGRKIWWDLGKRRTLPIMMQMVNNDRYLIFLNDCRVYADHNLFEFDIKQKNSILVAALLNSTLTAINRELASRINLGDGATKTEGVDWSNNVLIFNPSLLSKKQIDIIIRQFGRIKGRTIQSIHEEIKLSDRKALDSAVLKAMGFEPTTYLEPLYKGLCELVNERLSLPKMRKKIAKAKLDTSYEEAKKQVDIDILADGLKRFPDAFVEGISQSKFIEINTSGKPLKIGPHFFGKYEIVDESGKKVCDADGQDMARYIICAYRPDEFAISVPKSQKDITKAVQSYQRYIEITYQKLYERGLSATNDHKTASRIARELISEYGYCGDFELE